MPLFARLSRLVDAFSFARARGTWRHDLADPSLQFLNGWLGSGRGDPNLPLVHALLDQVTRGSTETGDPLKYTARLTRVWTAMRELGEAGEAAATDREFAPLWDRARAMRESW
jgi:hypothetical protein